MGRRLTPSTGALDGKIVVVTGGARGIGRAFTEGFLSAGARVAAIDISWKPSGASGDTDGKWMSDAQQRDDVLALTCDITDASQVQRAFDATIARFGTVDALCNNAALLQRHIYPPGGTPMPVLDTTNEDFRRMFEVNVFGTLTVTRQFVKPMLARRRGSVMTMVSSGVLMRSEGGAYALLRPDSREQPYMSSKAAIAHVMCYLADELRPQNVAVNCIVPLHARSTGYEEWAVAREKGRGSRGNTPYHPDHVQPLGCFLAQQDAQSGNTGKIFVSASWLPEHGHPIARWLAPDPESAEGQSRPASR
ncbi:MAG: SDR family oxidoreductase [Chloroflexota bacterium]|nr:SDR family oxidoreductase [Chloroflexota bacterium]